MNLKTLLEAENADELKKRLAVLPLIPGRPKPTRKAQFIEEITELMTPPFLKQYWEEMNDCEKNAIRESIYSTHGDFNHDQFFAKYKIYPQFFQKPEARYRSEQKFLLFGALFFDYCLPDEVAQSFRTFVSKPNADKIHSSTIDTESQIRTVSTEYAAQTELQGLLRLVETKKLKASEKTGDASGATILLIANKLYGGDFYNDADEDPSEWADKIGAIRAFAWPQILMTGKLINLNGNTLQLTSQGKKALNEEPAHLSLKILWERWLQHAEDEFRRISIIKGQTGKGGKRCFTKASDRRTLIAKALQDLPLEKWVAFAELSRYMQSTTPQFSITHGDPWDLYICDREYGSLGYDGYHGWNILEERYILCLLFEYAATLGLIDIAYVSPIDARRDYRGMWGTDELSFLSRYDGLRYVKLNSLGAYCLGLCKDYTLHDTKQPHCALELTHNGYLTVTSPAVVPLDMASLLDLFASRETQTSWKISSESLLNAQNSGHSLELLTSFLDKHAVDLPASMAALLDELSFKSMQLKKAGAAIMIECSSPEVADFFSTHPKLKRFCYRMAPLILGIPEENFTKCQTEMKKLGYPLRC